MDDETAPRAGDTARVRRRWVLAAAAGLLLAVGGPASADGDNHAPDLSGVRIQPAYHGHLVSREDVAALQAQGLATASALNRELACQGVQLYFDTDDERDAYLAGYLTRFPSEPPYLTGDPCRPYRNSPLLVERE